MTILTILNNIDQTTMPKPIKEAWETYLRGGLLKDLNLACAKWTADNFSLFVPTKLPYKPNQVSDYDSLSASELKKINPTAQTRLEQQKESYLNARHKAELQNKGNYDYLVECNNLTPDIHLKNLITHYKEDFNMGDG